VVTNPRETVWLNFIRKDAGAQMTWAKTSYGVKKTATFPESRSGFGQET
jgi:hypothetical protein